MLVREYFVDSSGWGGDGIALEVNQFKKALKIGFGYAITQCGQFQCYIGEYKKVQR